MLKVINPQVSDKMQKIGKLTVVAMSGGTYDQPKARYFDATLKDVEKLRNPKTKSSLFTSEDLNEVVEVDKVEKTREIDTGLEAMLKEGSAESHDSPTDTGSGVPDAMGDDVEGGSE